MTLLTAASSFLSPALSRQASGLRAQLDRAATELTTGKATDTGAKVKGDFRMLSGIDAALAKIDGYGTVIAEASLTATAMQEAVAVIGTASAGLLATMASTTAVQTTHQLGAVAAQGAAALDTAIAMLNTTTAGRSLFGGEVAARPPLPEAAAILDAAGLATAGVTDAASAETAIAAWFADPAGFAALYAGGDPRSALPVAEGEAVALDVTALDDGFRSTLRGLVTMALLDRGLLGANPAERRALALSTVTVLAEGSSRISDVAGRIGVAEEKLANAESRNAAGTSALGIARNAVVETDPYEAAARLQDLETRLDAFYTLMSRLSRLSLTEYL